MFPTKIKVACILGAVFLLAFGVLGFTDSNVLVATVLRATYNQETDCILKLPEEKRGTSYDFVKHRLNTDSEKDIILTATSEDQCGSAGCTHELCIITDSTAKIVSFGYAAETLIVKDTASNGMYDIQLQGKSTTNLQWDGSRYIVLH